MNQKKSIWLCYFIVTGLLLIFNNSCKKANEWSADKVTDGDGNVYNTITIGTQVWMKENLKTTKYNDGTSIPFVAESSAWVSLNTPGYCWFNNDFANKETYGALYNWYTVNTCRLCPTGWHVPSDGEWTTLTTYLGGVSVAGGKLKETGTAHWLSPNTGATNETGFTGLPGGYRIYNGIFQWSNGVRGQWWSSTIDIEGYILARGLLYNETNIEVGGWQPSATGMSIRCLKDN